MKIDQKYIFKHFLNIFQSSSFLQSHAPPSPTANMKAGGERIASRVKKIREKSDDRHLKITGLLKVLNFNSLCLPQYISFAIKYKVCLTFYFYFNPILKFAVINLVQSAHYLKCHNKIRTLTLSPPLGLIIYYKTFYFLEKTHMPTIL